MTAFGIALVVIAFAVEHLSRWWKSFVNREEIAVKERISQLKIKISKLNYPATFVEYSKANRELMKVQKQLEDIKKKTAKRRSRSNMVEIGFGYVLVPLVIIACSWNGVAFGRFPSWLYPSVKPLMFYFCARGVFRKFKLVNDRER